MGPEQHPQHHLDLAASLTLDQIVSLVLEGVVVGDGGHQKNGCLESQGFSCPEGLGGIQCGGSLSMDQDRSAIISSTQPQRRAIAIRSIAIENSLSMEHGKKSLAAICLGLDEEFQTANCFSELLHGYTIGVVAPYVMLGLQPMSAIRVTLEVIVPSPTGLTPEKWKQTATLCPLDWPSNYSFLRLWHITEGIHEFVAALARQMQHVFVMENRSWQVH